MPTVPLLFILYPLLRTFLSVNFLFLPGLVQEPPRKVAQARKKPDGRLQELSFQRNKRYPALRGQPLRLLSLQLAEDGLAPRRQTLPDRVALEPGAQLYVTSDHAGAQFFAKLIRAVEYEHEQRAGLHGPSR